MPPNPEAICPYDFWQKFDSESEDLVELTCLMPNGIVFLIHLGQNASLQEIKEEIWEEAEQYPLYGSLRDKSEYALSAICNKGYTVQTDEILDETKRLRDVQPYFNLIKVTERSTISNNVLNKNIEELIGKPIQELRDTGSLEVNDFRFKMGAMAEDISKDRFNNTFFEKLMYQFPPRLARSKDIPKTIRGRLAEDKFMLVSKFENDDNSFTHKVSFTITPQHLLEKILAKKELTMNKRFERISEFILKVCGQDEYIYGEHPIIQFLYIQDTLSRDGVPQLVIQSKSNINLANDIEYEPMVYPVIETKKSVSGEKTIKRKKVMTSWDLDVPYQVTIKEIRSLNSYTNKNIEIALQAGLFHGGKSLCKPQSTNIVQTLLQEKVPFRHTLVFDIHLPNLPRTARLCIVLFEILKSAKGQNRRRVKINNKDYFINPLGWVNTTVFDFKNSLKIDGLTLYTWSGMEESDSLFNPLGTIESNPRKEDDGAAIIVQLSRYTNSDAVAILYPSEEKILSHANMLAVSKNLNRDSAQDTRSIEEIMAPYANNNRINEMHDQERNAIWSKRTDCLINLPERVPCLLHCVEWNDRDEVCEMISLLQRWPPLSVESALELLDYAYADPIVRTFAVKSLRKLKDEELLLYLLQLVQAIKHEPYSYSALVEFLLLRGLHNQRIGHHLFWHLRSEMHVPAVQIRYGIIIEAYLKGSQQHVPILLRQKACVDELKKASALAKRGSKDKARAQLYEYLEKPSVKLIISHFVCPLNPSFRCKEIQLDKCKVMDSKMRPLWIVFDNHDSHGDEICLIYKDGDDLRQDMLTLQMLRVMDRIWKDHGYDFRMNPYNCASTERRSGLIEVVLNAETIANIQKERGMFSATSPFKKGSLFAWLKEHNPTDELDKAIHEFTLSCAGYCVATYVLGVADRHSDNIMVKRSGQLFHVDFGHILGHFKEKFGFRRERVPFVLTHDFVYVINKGKTDRETDEFRTFKTLCEKAFLLLREHGSLILSLFSMMISTGLPELSSEKDLNYLRETLVLDLSEEEACEHFRSKFSEALLNSWKTSLNWASHNFSKNNKQ